MNKQAPLFNAYLFIKKSRFRKKKEMNKMAFELMVDKTTAAYLLLVVGYLFASFFIFGDYIREFDDTFKFIEENMRQGFWLVLTALPIRYILRSFRDPGVLFSSSEYQLGMLPYSRKRIWLVTVIEKRIKQLLLYTIFGGIVILVTPISASVIIPYLALLLACDIIMAVPQWRLFQKTIPVKIGWLCIMVVINAGGVFIGSPIVGLLLVVMIIGSNFHLLHSLFAGVKWDKVTELSDFRIWNRLLIAKASNVKFKRNRKYGIFANTKRRKNPFDYTEKAIHHRIWQIYFGKNLDLIMQLIGALFILLFVLLFINNLLFQIGVAFTVYAYSSVASSFFNDRFQVDIIQVLPWNLARYRKTFFKWVLYGAVPLLIPIIIFLALNFTYWAAFQFVLYCSTFLYSYHTKAEKATGVLAKKSFNATWSESLEFIFLIAIVFSSHYPYVTLCFIFIVVLLMMRKSRFYVETV